ncbi:hypothetical protein [Acidovorax facilis]|uniref:hypothetical protein n=1 Tax=Acidovorax facilis TaxID=12917 RepID=UPI003D64FAD0
MLLLHAAEAFLAIFRGILFALLFNSAARWTRVKTGLPYSGVLAFSIIAPLTVLSRGVWLAAPAVSEQTARLVERVPEALRQLQGQLREWTWTKQAPRNRAIHFFSAARH